MSANIRNIRKLAKKNTDFRREVLTNAHCQVVLMSIEPGDDIGEEVHEGIDQLIVIVDGEARAIIEGEKTKVEDGALISVPAGTRHNLVNTDDEPLKLYTIYSPPEMPAGTMHATKTDAAAHA